MDKQIMLLLLLLVISISLFANLVQAEGFSNSNSSSTTQDQLTAHTAKAMVITCMDFRLIDDAVNYLNAQGYNNNYDEFILAGASLGYNQSTYSAWAETLDKHIELSEQLHDVTEIIVIDHMGCGAYKLFYNKDSISESEEVKLHKENFAKFRKTMKKKHPQFKVRTLLMKLTGEVLEL